MSKKTYTKKQLLSAWKKGVKTYAGAARILGCSPTTAKKHLAEITDRVTNTKVSSPKKYNKYIDPEVEKLVNIQMEIEADTRKKTIANIVSKIKRSERTIKANQAEIEKHETQLREMNLFGDE